MIITPSGVKKTSTAYIAILDLSRRRFFYGRHSKNYAFLANFLVPKLLNFTL